MGATAPGQGLSADSVLARVATAVGMDATEGGAVAPVAVCVALFVPAAAGLYLAALGDAALLTASLALLTGQLVLFVLIGAFSARVTDQRFYLAAAILVVFTFARILLHATFPRFAEDLLAYIFLGATLVAYASATRAQVFAGGLRRATLVRLVPVGATLGLFLAGFEAGLPSTRAEGGLATPSAAVIAGVIAFLDEYWFRGLLQGQAEATSGRFAGWLATSVLFAAAAAPSGDPFTVVYRLGSGLLLGYLVMRFRILPLALAARTVAAVAGVLLAGVVPTVLGTA